MVKNFLETADAFWPQILGAILVLLAGYFLGKTIAKIVRSFLNKIGLNQLLKRLGWEEFFAKIKIKTDFSKFFGEIVKWWVIIIFLMISVELIGLTGFSQFLEEILGYFPNIFIACLIFIIAAFLCDFTYKIFLMTGKKDGLIYSKFLGIGIRRTIWVLAALAIFYQLGIVPDLILSVFIAILALIVLSCGVAFGLGGKDLAKKILEEFKERVS